jgi:hypothetical protein
VPALPPNVNSDATAGLVSLAAASLFSVTIPKAATGADDPSPGMAAGLASRAGAGALAALAPELLGDTPAFGVAWASGGWLVAASTLAFVLDSITEIGSITSVSASVAVTGVKATALGCVAAFCSGRLAAGV